MATLSICTVVRDEERDLARGLESLQGLWDELIIVDTGSRDRTLEIARQYTPYVYEYAWRDDFAAAQNYAYSLATQDYTLKWDGDFELDPTSTQILLRAKQQDFGGGDILSVAWHIEHTRAGIPAKTVPRTLLSRNGLFEWVYPVHAKLTPKPGAVPVYKHLEGVAIHHRKNKELKAARYDQTHGILNTYLRTHPQNAYLRFFEAEGLMFAGEYVRARESWRIYRETATGFGEAEMRRVQGLERSVYTELSLGDVDEAKRLWLESTRRRPHWVEIPLLILARADIELLLDPEAARSWYERYCQVRSRPGVHTQDQHRNGTHPEAMLELIRSLKGR